MNKTQMIRLADVFFIGPVMMYGGSKLRERGDTGLGVTLMLLGVATILYNGKNYLKQREVGE